MTVLKSSFLNEATRRGFIHQCTDIEALDSLLLKENIKAYIGFDATATSLQVGNLAGIMFLRLLQKHGSTPIVLLGGATSKIGDPSGKDASRQLLYEEALTLNIQGIKKAFDKFLSFENIPNPAIMLNNNDWLAPLNYIEFLRDYGRHFSINRMLSFDSVKLRLEREQTLSFLEFNYMIFQAYDFMHLKQDHNCVLQMGGADQWGNIVNGVELTRRVLGKTVYGLTTPLIATSSGEKMGKTAKGAIWLNADRLSPYDYWQFWRNVEDNDVLRFMKIFTDISVEEIEDIQCEGAALNDVKKRLADATTTLAHGADALESIHKTVVGLFEKGDCLDLSTLPTFDVTREDLKTLYAEDVFVMTELVTSKGEARRLIQGNGGRLNDNVVTDAKATIDESLFTDGLLKVSSGKKKHHALRLI